MDKFVFLEHTADVLFEAQGFSFEEALENAALAMFSTISDVGALAEDESVELEERGESLEELSAFVLSDLLAESEAQELFLKEFKVSEFKKLDGGFYLKGVALGESMSPEKGKANVKAVTHHECKVWQEGNLWKVRVLLDI